ncbi:MAG: L-lactate permease [Acidobacteriota bacterium]
MWSQAYNPLGNAFLSTCAAALPAVVLLSALGIFRLRAHLAAVLGVVTSLVIAVFVFHMPAGMAVSATLFGAAYGLFPIGWIIINVIFLYRLTNERGLFGVLRHSITGVTRDRRLQLLLVAFCLGAFFEGAAGFGTPVAVTAAILIGLGFPPLQASGLSLIANTAPVAFGALGTPLIALQTVTNLDLLKLSAMAGRELAIFAIIIPFWLIAAFTGLQGMLAVWPALLVAGAAFAVPQWLISNYHGPWLVNVVAGVCSMAALVLFLRVWQPKDVWTSTGAAADARVAPEEMAPDSARIFQAWVPWLILSLLVFLWGVPWFKAWLDGLSIVRLPIPGLHNLVQRVPPVVARATPEAAMFNLNWLSATGSGIFLAAMIGGLVMGYKVRDLIRQYLRTLHDVRFSLLTIAAMMSVGYITRYSGLDATMGLAFAKTGVFYPIFGTLLGWLGVALTGSDTSSNVLFGSLQRITAEQLNLSPILMASANSAGGVMGKMIDAQSIVVASTATRWYGHEGDILRYVFFQSVALALLMGLLVFLQAYVYPFTLMVVQ